MIHAQILPWPPSYKRQSLSQPRRGGGPANTHTSRAAGPWRGRAPFPRRTTEEFPVPPPQICSSLVEIWGEGFLFVGPRHEIKRRHHPKRDRLGASSGSHTRLWRQDKAKPPSQPVCQHFSSCFSPCGPAAARATTLRALNPNPRFSSDFTWSLFSLVPRGDGGLIILKMVFRATFLVVRRACIIRECPIAIPLADPVGAASLHSPARDVVGPAPRCSMNRPLDPPRRRPIALPLRLGQDERGRRHGRLANGP